MEHIFPNWLNESFPKELLGETNVQFSTEMNGQLVRRLQYQQADPAGQRVGAVCQNCNNGWMSRLEGAVKPLLTPLIFGNKSLLSPEDQTLLATWAVKTSMVFEYTHGRLKNFSQLDRTNLMLELQPSGNVTVFAAFISTRSGPLANYFLIGRESNDYGMHVLQIGNLLLHLHRFENQGEVPKPNFDSVPFSRRIYPTAESVTLSFDEMRSFDDGTMLKFLNGT